MKDDSIFILGAGSVGRGISEIFHSQGISEIFFLDDNNAGKTINNVPVVGVIEDWKKYIEFKFIIAFGARDLAKRLKLFQEMNSSVELVNAIASNSFVSNSSVIGKNVIVFPQCSLMQNSVIGNCVSLCSNTSIDHDCIIGDGCHLSPGVHLAGNVKLENLALLGVGSSVIPGISIGKSSIVGAGSTVLKNVKNNTTVVGSPAKVINKGK